MVGCIGEGLHFGNRIHAGHAFAIHHIVQQMQGIARRRCACDADNTDGSVLRSSQRVGRVGDTIAVGTGQDGFVGIDNGLYLRCG